VPIRDFIDAAGIHWQVWSTVPATGGVAGAFRQGWLTFDSPIERRRLVPIPFNWEVASDSDLRGFCERATTVRITPRDGVQSVDPEAR
jgi:hypothetical protein